MIPEPHRTLTGTVLRIRRAYAHGVHDAGSKPDDDARDGYRRLYVRDREGTTLAPHQVVNAADAWALLIEDAIGRRGADLDLSVDPVPVLDHDLRTSPRCSTSDTRSWEVTAAQQGVRQTHESAGAGFRP